MVASSDFHFTVDVLITHLFPGKFGWSSTTPSKTTFPFSLSTGCHACSDGRFADGWSGGLFLLEDLESVRGFGQVFARPFFCVALDVTVIKSESSTIERHTASAASAAHATPHTPPTPKDATR